MLSGGEPEGRSKGVEERPQWSKNLENTEANCPNSRGSVSKFLLLLRLWVQLWLLAGKRVDILLPGEFAKTWKIAGGLVGMSPCRENPPSKLSEPGTETLLQPSAFRALSSPLPAVPMSTSCDVLRVQRTYHPEPWPLLQLRSHT